MGVCGQCGITSPVRGSGLSRVMPEAFVHKKLQQRGWVLGSRASADRCPACVGARRFPPPRETSPPPPPPALETPMANPVSPPLDEVAPIEPTREDKRRIRAALEEHYDDGRNQYTGAWNDERLAQKLNVPRKWVADIRDEFFGPAPSPELQAVKQELAALALRITKAETKQEQALAEIDACSKAGRDLLARVAKLEAGE